MLFRSIVVILYCTIPTHTTPTPTPTITTGSEVSEFFPYVVKNVSNRNVEVKKLVYMFLVHYADHDDSCRELALLSVNSFQNDMKDEGNQFIRGLALRVLTSIRVKDIISIQIYSIRSCIQDSSAYVRRIAATAICKVIRTTASSGSGGGSSGSGSNNTTYTECIPLLQTLLNDSSTLVLGAAVATFNEMYPGMCVCVCMCV